LAATALGLPGQPGRHGHKPGATKKDRTRKGRHASPHDQARRIQVQDQSPPRREPLGPRQVALAKREYGPGQHGQRRKNKPTDFGIQLMAKQKLKGYYGNIGEKQFRKYYDEAVRRKGDTSENLIELLERRLDTVIYRMKLAITPFAARQFVNHGHVLSTASASTSPPTRQGHAT
jgi:hypothetical protein